MNMRIDDNESDVLKLCNFLKRDAEKRSIQIKKESVKMSFK
jgi:hypothetical protein